MITIDQLLESVELNFEPRFVTKNRSGTIYIWKNKPTQDYLESMWVIGHYCDKQMIEAIKLAEFEGKDWTECIYEVPRKTTGKIKKIEVYGTLLDYKFEPTQKFEPMTFMELIKKINELVDAVNELKEKFALPTLTPDLTDEDLRKMMRDPKYWRDKDSATIQKVQNGFNKLYGNKN